MAQLGLVLLLLFGGVYCSRCKPQAKSPADNIIRVQLRGGTTTGELRLALRATYPERAASLGRVAGKEIHGQLFVYPRDHALGLDLSSAEVNVDVVLLDDHRRVVRVVSGLAAHTRRRVDAVPSLFRFAMVLPSGAAKKHGFGKGTAATFSLPDHAAPQRVLTPVVLYPSGRPSVRVLAELAIQEKERNMGLMYRTHLPPRGGMLFRFPFAHGIKFWMRNTLISLDMIFIGPKGHVTGVVHGATPKDDRAVGPDGVMSQYVLEMKAGFAKRYGVTRGTRVAFTLP